LGIPLGGQPDKTRQLARQVGERIRDPLENSMAIFKFPSPVLPEGMTFVFSSWVYVANGAGRFRRHIVDDTIKLKTLASRLDDFVDSLDDLPFFDSARKPRQSLSLLFLFPSWKSTWTFCSRLEVPRPPHVGGLRITWPLVG
jgi:hypothetical protein